MDIHNPVFVISASFIIIFVALSLLFQEQSAEFSGWFRPWLTSTFDRFLMFAGNLMLVFCVFLAISPLGKVRIGSKDAKPDYSYPGWNAMLFSAGIGIGLLFFGVFEPMYFSLPELSALPLGLDPSAAGNQNMAIVANVFHWGFSGWTVYVIVGLVGACHRYSGSLCPNQSGPHGSGVRALRDGGLNALQGAAVSMGTPFTIVVLVMYYCLYVALRSKRMKIYLYSCR